MLGMGIANIFGLDPRAGLLVGSVSLVGGIGTTLAWVPDFVERLGIHNALEIGTAGSMLGLIIACIIGGPIASYLMREHKLTPSHDTRLDIGVAHNADSSETRLDYYGVLRAWLWLNLALLLGQGLTRVLGYTGLNLPDFVGSLMAGIVLRNTLPLLLPKQSARNWKKTTQGLALISDICLGMFLTMALMGLQLWALKGVFSFVFATLVLQVVLTVVYTLWIVFRFMGKDYEAAVLCAGFGGIALGSTSTAVANMSAVTRQYGAAHRAFINAPGPYRAAGRSTASSAASTMVARTSSPTFRPFMSTSGGTFSVSVRVAPRSVTVRSFAFRAVMVARMSTVRRPAVPGNAPAAALMRSVVSVRSRMPPCDAFSSLAIAAAA